MSASKLKIASRKSVFRERFWEAFSEELALVEPFFVRVGMLG